MNHFEKSQLAMEIAEGLKDSNALPLFMSYTEKYPEAFLREKLNHVLSLSDSQVKKSRAALFVHLVTGGKRAGKDSYHYQEEAQCEYCGSRY